MRLGTAFAHALRSSGAVSSDADPWPAVDAVLRAAGVSPPDEAFRPDLDAIRRTWMGRSLDDDRRLLLRLLSRFSLSPEESKRWYDRRRRDEATQRPVLDDEIIRNPYVIAEEDLGGDGEAPIALATLDRGLSSEDTYSVAASHSRNCRELRPQMTQGEFAPQSWQFSWGGSADEGDSLLSTDETIARLASVNLGTAPAKSRQTGFQRTVTLSEEQSM